MIDCMKTKDLDDLVHLKYSNLTWRPNFDGELFYDYQQNNQFNKNLKSFNMLIGDNVGDSWGFSLTGQTLLEALQDMITEVSDRYENDEYLADFLYHWAIDYLQETREKAEQKGFTDSIQGYAFTKAQIQLAELQKPNKVFTYRIKIKTIFQIFLDKLGYEDVLHDYFGCEEVENSCGTLHGEDMLFLFGHPMFRTSAWFASLPIPGIDFGLDWHNSARLGASRRMVEMLKNFVWTDDPNTSPDWWIEMYGNSTDHDVQDKIIPEYDLTNPQRLNFNGFSESIASRKSKDSIENHDDFHTKDSFDAIINLANIRVADCGYGEPTEFNNETKVADFRNEFTANEKFREPVFNFTLYKYANFVERFKYSEIYWGWVFKTRWKGVLKNSYFMLNHSFYRGYAFLCKVMTYNFILFFKLGQVISQQSPVQLYLLL